MKKVIIFDASAFSWTGSSTYISDFISHIEHHTDVIYFIICPSALVDSMFAPAYHNASFFSLDDIFLFRLLGKFIVKHVLLFYLTLVTYVNCHKFAVIINTPHLFVPFAAHSTRIWHNSLQLGPIPFSLLRRSPRRFFRLHLERLLDRFSYKRFYSHVFPSIFCQKIVHQNYGNNNLEIVAPHSVDYLIEFNLRARSLVHKKGNNLPHAPINIIYVAAIDTYKNHMLAVSALEKLEKHPIYDQLHFHFVGPLVSNAVLSAIRSSKPFLHSKISLHNRLPFEQVVSLLRSCHIALALSSTETFGYPVPEAFAFGIPLIAYDHPCNKELAGSCALYIRNPSELVTAITSVTLSPASYLDQTTSSFQRFDFLKTYCRDYFKKISHVLYFND